MQPDQPNQPTAAAGEELPQDEEIYKSDSFRMQCMKVLPCSKRFVHDWTECPFAHPQEKARRRDPRVHNYTGIACPSMKKEGCCAFGDHCPYAHNVFEYWLHPTRYRTQLCNDGSNCKRKICFFAHSLDELRVPACKPFVSPEALAAAAASAAADAEAKRKAATIGSPLSAFATLSPGPSPQRSSLEALRAAQQAQEGRASGGASVAAPSSPQTNEGETHMASSPAETAVHQALQHLSGVGFSSQEQQVIELVTTLLSQDKVSPEQAASILQQMLPPDALSNLQVHLNTPRASMEDARPYSDPLGYRVDAPAGNGAPMRSSLDSMSALAERASSAPRTVAATLLPGPMAQPQQQQQPQGGMAMQGSPSGGRMEGNPRLSTESTRSSFDTARMSFDTAGRASMDFISPRGSMESSYPPSMGQAGISYPGQGFWGAQLSPVPEQFPMINAPPPSASWGSNAAGRLSLDSAADRLSEDFHRMSFEAAAGGRAAPHMVNPYSSSLFAAAGGPAPAPNGGGFYSDRRTSLPPLAPLRTSAPVKLPGDLEEDAVGGQQQLLGGTAMHRLQ